MQQFVQGAFVSALSLFSLFVYSQRNPAIDVVRTEIETSGLDTNRVKLYIQLGQLYENTTPDSALLWYESALKLSKELGYARGVISYYTNATYVYNLMGRSDTALLLNIKSVEIAREFGDQERLAACISNLGASYMSLERNEEAIESFLQAIPIYEERKGKQQLAIIYDNLCVTYFNIDQYQKSIEYGEKALQLTRENEDPVGITTALINLSMALNKSGRIKKSVEALVEAQKWARKTDNQYALSVSMTNLGDGYISLSEYEKAWRCYEEAMVLSQKLHDQVTETIAIRGLAICSYVKGDLTSAESYAKQSLQIAASNQYVKHIGYGYGVLAEISLIKRDFQKSTLYTFKSDSIRTMLLNESVAKNVQNLEAKYEGEKKERQITQLKQQAEIRDLSIRKGRLVNYILIGSLMALVTIVLLARRNYHQKGKILERENALHQSRITELEREKQLTASEAVIKGQDEERGRLAKDLHDGLGGLLSGVKFSLTNMKSNVVLDGESALVFERSLDMLDHSILELRRVAHNMMPEVLINFGLAEALKSYCTSLAESGVFKINFQAISMVHRLPANKEVIVYRIVQELLNNIAKHARAVHVLVQLAMQNGELSVTVEDDGVGLDKAAIETTQSFGWSNIRSRVEYLRGKIDVQSAIGKGTSVHIILPV